MNTDDILMFATKRTWHWDYSESVCAQIVVKTLQLFNFSHFSSIWATFWHFNQIPSVMSSLRLIRIVSGSSWNSLYKELNLKRSCSLCVCMLEICSEAYTWCADEDPSERFWLVTASRCRGRVAVGGRPSAPGPLHPREGPLVQVGTEGNGPTDRRYRLSKLPVQTESQAPTHFPHRFSRDWWLHGLRTINRGWNFWFVISS